MTLSSDGGTPRAASDGTFHRAGGRVCQRPTRGRKRGGLLSPRTVCVPDPAPPVPGRRASGYERREDESIP